VLRGDDGRKRHRESQNHRAHGTSGATSIEPVATPEVYPSPLYR
jgi:hypothetical protein